MRKSNLKKTSLILLLAVSFILGIFAGPLSAAEAKYKDYPVPQDCMDQVRKEGSKLFLYDWAEWWPEKIFADFSKEFGVQITRDHYSSSDEMITKLKLNPNRPSKPRTRTRSGKLRGPGYYCLLEPHTQQHHILRIIRQAIIAATS